MRRKTRRISMILGIASLLIGSVALMVSPAQGAQRLISVSPQTHSFSNIAPGDTVQWLTSVESSQQAAINLTMDVVGDDSDLFKTGIGSMYVQAQSCSRPWASNQSCPGTITEVMANTAITPVASQKIALPPMAKNSTVEYLFTATLPSVAGNDRTGQGTATFNITAQSQPDYRPTPFPVPLPRTGVDAEWIVLFGLGMVLIGVVLCAASLRTRRND